MLQVHQSLRAEQMEGGDGVDMADVSLKHGGKSSQMPLMISQFMNAKFKLNLIEHKTTPHGSITVKKNTKIKY